MKSLSNLRNCARMGKFVASVAAFVLADDSWMGNWELVGGGGGGSN